VQGILLPINCCIPVYFFALNINLNSKTMKKIFSTLGIAAAMLAFFSSNANAQYGGKGQMDLNVGVGLGTTLGLGGGLPISAALDYGINDNISVGGYVGFVSQSEDVGFLTTKQTNIIIGARGAYHLDLIDNVDTYGGLLLGYNIVSAEVTSNNPIFPAGVAAGGSAVAFSGFIGGRYHFTDNIGAFAELGYGIAYLQLGLTYKF
jgi:hypothetical protein